MLTAARVTMAQRTVYQSRMPGSARPEIGPERDEEVVIGAERHAAHNIAERGPEEDDQQDTGEREGAVEERSPDGIGQVHAQLDAERPKDQQPEHDVQRADRIR